jgi:hypothetical protein
VKSQKKMKKLWKHENLKQFQNTRAVTQTLQFKFVKKIFKKINLKKGKAFCALPF